MWVDLVNLSTITDTTSYPEGVLGNPTTRSINILSYFDLGISKGCKSLACVWCFILIFLRHWATKLAVSHFILFHQNNFLRSWHILVVPGCIVTCYNMPQIKPFFSVLHYWVHIVFLHISQSPSYQCENAQFV